MKRANMKFAPASIALALVLSAPSAHATGVSAGTLIENTATATYNAGSSSVSVSSNTVKVTVDELLDVAVASLSGAPVAAGLTEVAIPFSVTNTGNGPEAFKLSVNPTVAGNQFDASLVSTVIDSNDNGTYEPGVDTVLASGAPTPAIAADDTLRVFVIVTIPAGATDGQTSQLQLTAEAVTGTGTPGTAFAGQGQGGGDAVVGSSGANDVDAASIVASTVSVSLTKSAAIADPFGGNQSVPGAVVTYTLVASVTGSGPASDLRITDVIPTGTTYQAGTLTLAGGPLSDAADSDAGKASSAGIDVDLGDVAGGSSGTVTFKVKIN
ncbi:MAG: hypothetical protein RIQ46_1158 [Pseudomonadota bacterium]